MEYGVSVDLRPPAGASDLDPLQAEGAGSLLDRMLEQVDGAEDEQGDIAVERYWVGSHPEGALVLLVLHAQSLAVAEAAARAIMLEVLQRSELLTDWQVTGCEVGFDERFAQAGLQAADGPHAPPDDPAERAQWLAQQPAPTARPADTGPEIDWRQYVIDHAALLRAFDLDVFDADADTAKLAAGALMFVCTTTIDELFQDIETLAHDDSTVADSDGVFMVLEDLPERFAHHYNGRFARQFLVATIMITGRLTHNDWSPPASVAEALALHLIVQAARTLLDSHELLDGDVVDRLYLGFDDAAYEDVDHEWLYRLDLDGFEDDPDFTQRFGPVDMRVGSWFQQIPGADAKVHPFAVDIDARTLPGPASAGQA